MTEKSRPLLSGAPWAAREAKPRQRGINYVRGPAVLGGYLNDFIGCYAEHIDILKLSGHQVTFSSPESISEAIKICHSNSIKVAVGNPPMDVALSGGWGVTCGFLDELLARGIDYVEISCIARAIDDGDLEKVILAAKQRNIDVIIEVGVEFAHSQSEDGNLFIERRIQQAKLALQAGAKMILVESEGLTENRNGQAYRWDVIDRIASNFPTEQLMFEADDQDVLSRYIEVFGPKSNLMVDHTKVEKLEAARRGFGPSQSLWGKVVTV